MEQCVVDGEDQVGHHLPQQDGTLVILPIAEAHGDQCAEPDELVKYVHPSFLLIKNAAHPVGCVAKNGGDAPEKSTLILEFYYTMGQPYLSIAAKDNLQKPWAFGGEWRRRRDLNSEKLISIRHIRSICLYSCVLDSIL